MNSESVGIGIPLQWAELNCARLPNEYHAAIVHTTTNRRKWWDIPIPTFTYAQPFYPGTAQGNIDRCHKAEHTVVFKGQTQYTPERQQMMAALASFPGAVLEDSGYYGGGALDPNGQGLQMRSDRMAELLSNSKFGLVPCGDGWHSYRLMETMAMGVVPIILSDGWSLPFEDILDWSEFSIRIQADALTTIPDVIAAHAETACEMRAKVYDVYHTYLKDPDAIMHGIDLSMQRTPQDWPTV
jgi:hypothetical protein